MQHCPPRPRAQTGTDIGTLCPGAGEAPAGQWELTRGHAGLTAPLPGEKAAGWAWGSAPNLGKCVPHRGQQEGARLSPPLAQTEQPTPWQSTGLGRHASPSGRGAVRHPWPQQSPGRWPRAPTRHCSEGRPRRNPLLSRRSRPLVGDSGSLYPPNPGSEKGDPQGAAAVHTVNSLPKTTRETWQTVHLSDAGWSVQPAEQRSAGGPQTARAVGPSVTTAGG